MILCSSSEMGGGVLFEVSGSAAEVVEGKESNENRTSNGDGTDGEMRGRNDISLSNDADGA